MRFSPSPTLLHTTLTFVILTVVDDRRCCCADHRFSSQFYPNRLLRALIADDGRCSDHRCCCATVTMIISVLLIIVFTVLTSLNMYIEAAITKDELQHLALLFKSEFDSIGQITAGVLRLLKLEGSVGQAIIDQLGNLGYLQRDNIEDDDNED
ncbi:hypothetical protein Ahy_A08g039450 isoform C [Arachis hypogaea]|uniref:Uncharacterized protein n=1 Tax=Arachis hypogaea TaxID=3818 RepID=A0A445BWC6_ARAHY|nr:hypothetical protein Ahy_A08g039450 isoform C [Arachis hypogaea]